MPESEDIVSIPYRILRVWSFWADGIKYHDHYLAEFMAVDGVSTVFACPDYAGPDFASFTEGKKRRAENREYGLMFLKYFLVFGKPFPYQLIKFKKEIESLEPHIIHIYGISNFTTVFTLIAAKLAKFPGKIIFNDHSDPTCRKTGLIPLIYYLMFFMIYRVLIRDKFTIFVPDLSAREELIRRYGSSISKVIKVTSLGYDNRVYYSRPKLRQKGLPLVIGFAGKIFPEKRLELLIDAVLRFSHDDVELHIAGLNLDSPSAYQCELIKYIESTGRNNIYIKKFMTSADELASFYSKLDVAVFPGSVSITTFEANGCGCPIILYKSIDGLEHRVSPLRGMLFETEQQLFDGIDHFLQLKKHAKIDHDGIEAETKTYSWSNLKHVYYEEYGFFTDKC